MTPPPESRRRKSEQDDDWDFSRAAQMAARCLRLGSGLLPEDVVGQLATPLRIDEVGSERRQLAECVTRELAHARGRKIEHLADLVIALALTQNELDDRPLVRRELVEGGHRRHS